MFPIRIDDDRGERTDLYAPGRKRIIAGAYERGSTGLGVIQEATGRKGSRWNGWVIFNAVGLTLSVAVLLLLTASLVRGRQYGFAVVMVLLLALTVGDLVVRRWYRRWRHREEIARALRATNRCASCGYDLGGIDVDAEAMLVCPECGSSWREDRRRAIAEGEESRWARPFPWITKRVRDDRGWWGRPKYGLRASLIGRGMARRAVICRASGALGIASYVFGWLVLPSLVVFIATLPFMDRHMIAGVAILVFLSSVFMQIVLWALARNLRSEQIRLALLDRGFCPSCDERLPEEPESDGCRVCEGCGSAWEASGPIS